jgi:uncharacterized oxidoreductase
MTSSINTLLLIGATSGLGEAFARRFHSMGKTVIITGRRTDRLDSLAKELPGLKTYAMDLTDLSSLPEHAKQLTTKYPEIDGIWLNSGIQTAYSFKEHNPPLNDTQIIDEVNLNSTSYVLLTKHFLPHLQSKKTANLIMTSSGLGYTPFPFGPVYAATKAFVHSFCVSLRIHLKDTNMNVMEIVPPYVDVSANRAMGGKVAMHAISVEEFVEGVMRKWEGMGGEEVRELAVGTAEQRVKAWRGAMQGVWEGYGMSEERK